MLPEPPKCPVLDSNLITKAQMPPSREPQGNVTAEEKIKYLSDWLDDALLYGRKTHDKLNLLIDNVTCNRAL